MAFFDEYDFGALVNEKERWVIDEVERQLANKTDICRCQECILDIVTLALNNSKPAYRVTLMGAIYAESVNAEFHDEIEKAVELAIDKIKKNPWHVTK